jgi:hypothetical protein
MTRAGVFAITVLTIAALAPPARADVAAPIELATGSLGFSMVADIDAAGSTTVVTSSGRQGPRIVGRAPDGTWSAPVPLPGSPAGVAGPVVDAAGQGALGIAWRVDVPKHYAGIAVAMRDPGATLSEPVQVAGADAGGVRQPALAIDPAGDALLAYNTDTNAVHLNMRGAIAIAYRESRGSFSMPTVVDPKPSSAPAVAIGRDGTGIVTWTHDRRVYAVSVGADGEIGKAKAIASANSAVGLVPAAGEDGAATLAWISRRPLATGRIARSRYDVRALGRTAGHVFAGARTVASSSDYVRRLAIAADEDARVTLAWSREHFGDAGSVGNNGITSAILAATAQAGRPFPAPRVVAPRRGRYLTPPLLAAANGRVALAWAFAANRRDLGVQAALGPPGAIGPPETVVRKTLTSVFATQAPIAVALDPVGIATVLYVEPPATVTPTPVFRLLAADVR